MELNGCLEVEAYNTALYVLLRGAIDHFWEQVWLDGMHDRELRAAEHFSFVVELVEDDDFLISPASPSC